MEKQIYTITQVNEYLCKRMDSDPILSQIAVQGEISNYKMYPSGHHYFTLKDDRSALKCVMFKGNAVRLRFRPENGMHVIAIGRISVYPRDGAFQLYCTTMTVNGVGDLYAAFEQSKAKLAAEGLFDKEHKQSLPQYPGVIGIVTSSAGAAIHDMLRILRKRYPLTTVRLFPVRVQGTEAPGEIVAAIHYANRYQLSDLLIVGRGGGSIEDLWSFNDEDVARAIYGSKIPIISAVGHEPDVTISDYVADLRAATPSNAAELAVPDKESLQQTIDSMVSTVTISLNRMVKGARQRLDVLCSSPVLLQPTGYLEQKKKDLDILKKRLTSAHIQSLSCCRQRYIGTIAKLDAMSPLKVLSRGYSVVHNASGDIVRSTSQVEIGDAVLVSLAEGKLYTQVIQKENGNE